VNKVNRYLFQHLISKVTLCLSGFVALFLVFDFFDRIDNILQESTSIVVIGSYFVYKIPGIVVLMLPVSVLTGTLLSVSILSKSSEITAMRAAGHSLFSLVAPYVVLGILLSLVSFGLNETIVPWSNRRAREVYNIDIKEKDKSGGYSQQNLWWRDANIFYSASVFDSRQNTLSDVTVFRVDANFSVLERLDATKVNYLRSGLGWNMSKVEQTTFHPRPLTQTFEYLPLPISKVPVDFYDVNTDSSTMSFGQLRKFIKLQRHNGVSTQQYLADLYEKLSFPFSCALIGMVVFPFAIRSQRNGGLGAGIIAAIGIGFSYYVIHSLSLSLGRAEFIPPLVSAWIANVLFLITGLLLIAGSDTPA
jgi:lipopolysaccharide export system permease protein